MGSLGFLGIYAEAGRIMVSRGKQYLVLTLLFFLPMTVLNIGTAQFYVNQSFDSSSTSSIVGSLVALLLLFILYSLFYLAAIATITYVAFEAFRDLHRGQEGMAASVDIGDSSISTTLRTLRRSLPRLILTMLCLLLLYILVSLAFSLLGVALAYLFRAFGTSVGVGIIIAYVLLAVFLIYLWMIWCLATVVPVLERSCWWKALKRSQTLVKGKMWLVFFVMLVLIVTSVGVELLTAYLASSVYIARKVTAGILLIIMNWVSMVYGQTVITLLYVACKKHHNEPLDGAAGTGTSLQYQEFATTSTTNPV